MIAFARIAALCCALFASTPTLAQGGAGAGYPNRPVKVIVPFAAGGPTDVIARLIAAKLSERLGQQFYVENHPGAGSNIGMGLAARAPGDGYTITVVGSSFIVNPGLYAKIPYDPHKDFAPITLICTSPNIVVVHPSVPVTNVQELIALIRANPGKHSYASPGTGTTPHLAGELFRLNLKLDLVHIPFASAGLAVNSILGNHTPIGFLAVPPTTGSVKEGTMRGIAVMSARRTPALPDVPTMAESGVAGLESDAFTAMLAPAGTPKEIVDLIYRETAQMLATPEVKDRLAALGFEIAASTPEEFAAWLPKEIEKWRKVVHDANIKIE